MADMENTLGNLQEVLNRNVLSSCQYPLGAIVKSELLDAAVIYILSTIIGKLINSVTEC